MGVGLNAVKESKYLIKMPITKRIFLLTGDPMSMNLNGKTKDRTTIIHDRVAHKLRRKKTTSEAMFDLICLRQLYIGVNTTAVLWLIYREMTDSDTL